MVNEKSLIDTIIKDGIGRITINRAEKRNAMTLGMWRDLGAVLEAWAENSEIRTLIIAGAGDLSFCAGNDIKEYATIRVTPEQRETYDATTTHTYDLLRTFPKPTIARITGFCVGGGMELALLCDLQIAADTATFGVTPARLGIGYKLNDVQLLLTNISAKHAKEILYTADRFPADDAVRWGLISRSVPAGELDATIATLAARIAANAPMTVNALKQTIHEAIKAEPNEDLCNALVAACDASSDRIEGQAAFAEKRKPKFTGT